MSRLSYRCKFCGENLKDGDKCDSRCDERVKEELSRLDNYPLHENIHKTIISVTNDKWGNNWKYDMCDFCNICCIGERMSINGVGYNFCSSKCIIATMGRIYKAVEEESKN